MPASAPRLWPWVRGWLRCCWPCGTPPSLAAGDSSSPAHLPFSPAPSGPTPLSTAPCGWDWALCRLNCSRSGRAGHNSRPLRAWSKRLAWADQHRGGLVGGPGGPCAAAGRCSPLPQPAGGSHRAAVALGWPNFGLGRRSTPRGRCVPGLGGALPGSVTAGVIGLIRCPFFAGHGLAACGDAGWELTAGKPRLNPPDPCAANWTAPASNSAACCWPFVASAIGSIPELYGRWPELVGSISSRSSGCSRTEWPGSAADVRAAGG